jgi:hypothetical protein
MIRKVHIAGVVALGLMLTAVYSSPAYSRIVSSARNFENCFHDLKGAGNSLSPLERFVFSLVLANSTASLETHVAAQEHRS